MGDIPLLGCLNRKMDFYLKASPSPCPCIEITWFWVHSLILSLFSLFNGKTTMFLSRKWKYCKKRLKWCPGIVWIWIIWCISLKNLAFNIVQKLVNIADWLLRLYKMIFYSFAALIRNILLSPLAQLREYCHISKLQQLELIQQNFDNSYVYVTKFC